MKRFLGLGEPSSAAIRDGTNNIRHHLDYLAWLSEERRWLAGDDFSLADIAAAAHLSCVDYLGAVPWDDHPPATDWYSRVKSPPHFQPPPGPHIPGCPHPRHHSALAFSSRRAPTPPTATGPA